MKESDIKNKSKEGEGKNIKKIIGLIANASPYVVPGAMVGFVVNDYLKIIGKNPVPELPILTMIGFYAIAFLGGLINMRLNQRRRKS